MKIQLPRFEIKIIKRNNVQQRVGTFDQHDRAVAYGEKYYAGRYIIVDRRPEEATEQ
jgi:hypothetical protein